MADENDVNSDDKTTTKVLAFLKATCHRTYHKTEIGSDHSMWHNAMAQCCSPDETTASTSAFVKAICQRTNYKMRCGCQTIQTKRRSTSGIGEAQAITLRRCAARTSRSGAFALQLT